MSTPTEDLAFQFISNISLDAYRTLWQGRLEEAKALFTELERERTENDIEGYLDELNAYDIASSSGDIRGGIWNEMHPDPEFREEGATAKKAFIALGSRVSTSAAIAANLATFKRTVHQLDEDSKRFLEEWTKELKKGGAFLPIEKQEQVRQLTKDIQAAADEYLENIRNDKGTLELDADAIRGVPEDYIQSRPEDPATGKITLHHKAADTMPILEYCQVQATREKVLLFHNGTASPINEPVLEKLLTLRAQKAALLGYENWAEYQLENTMIKSVANVTSFLDDAHDAIRPKAEQEKLQMTELLKEKDGVDIQPWDLWYGETLLKSHLLEGFSLGSTRQYFQIGKVFPALLQIVERLFCLRFEKIDDVQPWHSSVAASKVYDVSGGKESLIGRLFFDLYPRDGKLDGAAAYTAPQPTACMSYRNVQTILHELGHCVHGLVAAHRYADFAGLGGSEMDFLEVPSQMLELFLTDYRLFDFATNEKGELIPESVLKQLIAADRIGMRSLSRQVVLAKYAFQKGGDIMNADVATRYRKLILEQVGSRDADDAIIEFLGRKHDSKAYKEWLSATT
ncbi:hypothetical protein QFC22_000824 [Naganishia vaughanmartiniae]|uniref:Uncharacterized protein n=1 Tax=Naganishia vaughanmartiniae TaxID=1424756 RepID=A0ACC2XLY6_9TREE|nr:hypothetical protein QFC22_000824 [Naganishia vaughanmartiniae]